LGYKPTVARQQPAAPGWLVDFATFHKRQRFPRLAHIPGPYAYEISAPDGGVRHPAALLPHCGILPFGLRKHWHRKEEIPGVWSDLRGAGRPKFAVWIVFKGLDNSPVWRPLMAHRRLFSTEGTHPRGWERDGTGDLRTTEASRVGESYNLIHSYAVGMNSPKTTMRCCPREVYARQYSTGGKRETSFSPGWFGSVLPPISGYLDP